MRVTTGTVQVNNWQHDLVKGTPNLGHWHWNPIYANVQGLKTIRANTPPDRYKRRGGPAQMHPNVTVTAIQPRNRSVYTKPNHIPFNTTRRAGQNVNANLINRDVSANLNNRNVNANLVNRNVNANLVNRNVSATLRSPQVNASLANRDVNGVMMQGKPNTRLADRNGSGEMMNPSQQGQTPGQVPMQVQSPPPAPPKVATYGQNYGNSGDDFARISGGNSANQIAKGAVYGRIQMPKRGKTASVAKKNSIGY